MKNSRNAQVRNIKMADKEPCESVTPHIIIKDEHNRYQLQSVPWKSEEHEFLPSGQDETYKNYMRVLNNIGAMIDRCGGILVNF